jgi:hypothetical protein
MKLKRTLLFSGILFLIALAGICIGAETGALNFEELSFEKPNGVKVLKDFSGVPNEGIVKTFEVLPGSFEVATYWVCFNSKPWHNGGNRLQPEAVGTFDEMREGGLSVLFKLKDGRYLAVLPLAGPKTLGWLEGKSGRLLLHIGNLGTAKVEGDIPVVAWSRTGDPYSACREVWELAVESEPIKGRVKLRKDKSLPDVLNYLGFCTFEEYRGNYDEQKLLAMMKVLNSSGVPIRWIQIGAGHHDLKSLGDLGNGQKLNSFNPDPKKFPNGW